MEIIYKLCFRDGRMIKSSYNNPKGDIYKPNYESLEDKVDTSMDRRQFLNTLGLGIGALAVGFSPKRAYASEFWKDRKLIEIETDEIVEEYGIKFKIYKRKEPQDPHFFEVKYMLNPKDYIRRVFKDYDKIKRDAVWGEWAEKVLSPKDSIIMIYDPKALYTRKHWDFIRQEKIYQIFAKKYLDDKLNTNFDLYEINIEYCKDEDKSLLSDILHYPPGNKTIDAPSLIIKRKEDHVNIRGVPLKTETKNLVLAIFFLK